MQRVDPTDQSALAALRELLAETEQADGTPPVSDQALLSVAQGRRSLLRFADGEAYGVVGEGELDLVVRPGARGRGIGSAALRALLSEAAHSEPGGGDRPGGAAERTSIELRAWAHGENPAARSLLQASGFEAVRELLRMTLEPRLLGGAIAEARPLPEGFRMRPFDPARADADADEWVRVNAAAFASHPEQGAMRRGDFDALRRESWFSAEDLRLAFDDSGELAGFTWVKTTTVADDSGAETELYALGVDPRYAGRGLGAALLGETLRRMQQHSPARITLYVDGDNAGAVALYERAGFTVEQRSTQYLLRLLRATG